MTDDRDWDRVEEYVQLIGRMEETLRQADRLSIAKRLAEAEELLPKHD